MNENGELKKNKTQNSFFLSSVEQKSPSQNEIMTKLALSQMDKSGQCLPLLLSLSGLWAHPGAKASAVIGQFAPKGALLTQSSFATLLKTQWLASSNQTA